MKCEINELENILNKNDKIFQLSLVNEYLNKVGSKEYEDIEKKFINNNDIISNNLNSILLKLYFLYIHCKLNYYIYIQVKCDKLDFLKLELEDRKIKIEDYNIDSGNNLFISVLIKDIQKIYELTNVSLIKKISYIERLKFIERINKENYKKDSPKAKYHIRNLMYGWKPYHQRATNTGDNNDNLHEYLPPQFSEINNYIRNKQKEYWLFVYDNGLIMSEEINNIVDTYKNQIKHLKKSKINPYLTVQKIQDKLQYDKKKKNNFYKDFSNNDRNENFTVNDDKRQIISVISGTDENYKSGKGNVLVCFKDSTDLLNDANKNLNLYAKPPDYQGFNINMGISTRLLSMNQEKPDAPVESRFSDHGNPVCSCACGYYYGVAPNVNLVSVSNAFSPGNFNDFIKHSTSRTNYQYNNIQQLIDLSNKELKHSKIVAINNSVGFSPNVGKFNEVNNISKEYRKSSFIDVNENNDRFLYFIASGNSNDNCNSLQYPGADSCADDPPCHCPHLYLYNKWSKTKNKNLEDTAKISVILNEKDFDKVETGYKRDHPIIEYGLNKKINNEDYKYYGGNLIGENGSTVYHHHYYSRDININDKCKKNNELLVGALDYSQFSVMNNSDNTINLINNTVCDKDSDFENNECLNNKKRSDKTPLMTNFSTSGTPASNFNLIDFVAPGNVLCTDSKGNTQHIDGTSFSSPIIAGLSVLVRCIVEYFIEKENFPTYLRTKDMIANIMRESCVKIKDNNNNYINTFSQGYGVVCLYNVFMYIRDNGKENFIDPFVGITNKSDLPDCSQEQILKQTLQPQVCKRLEQNLERCKEKDLSKYCPASCGICKMQENYTWTENQVLKSIGNNYIESAESCETLNLNDKDIVYFNLDENECRDYVHYSRTPYINPVGESWKQEIDKSIDYQIKKGTNNKFCIKKFSVNGNFLDKVLFNDEIKDNNDKYICKKVIKKNKTRHPPCYKRNIVNIQSENRRKKENIVTNNMRQFLLQESDNTTNSCQTLEDYNFNDNDDFKNYIGKKQIQFENRECKYGFKKNNNLRCVEDSNVDNQITEPTPTQQTIIDNNYINKDIINIFERYLNDSFNFYIETDSNNNISKSDIIKYLQDNNFNFIDLDKKFKMSTGKSIFTEELINDLRNLNLTDINQSKILFTQTKQSNNTFYIIIGVGIIFFIIIMIIILKK